MALIGASLPQAWKNKSLSAGEQQRSGQRHRVEPTNPSEEEYLAFRSKHVNGSHRGKFTPGMEKQKPLRWRTTAFRPATSCRTYKPIRGGIPCLPIGTCKWLSSGQVYPRHGKTKASPLANNSVPASDIVSNLQTHPRRNTLPSDRNM